MLDFADFSSIVDHMSVYDIKYIRLDLLGPGDLFRMPDQTEVWAVLDPTFDRKLIQVLAVNKFFECRKFAPYIGVIPLKPREEECESSSCSSGANGGSSPSFCNPYLVD